MKTSPQRKWTATSSYGAPLGGKRLRLAHAAIAYVGARVRAGARVRVSAHRAPLEGLGEALRIRVATLLVHREVLALGLAWPGVGVRVGVRVGDRLGIRARG